MKLTHSIILEIIYTKKITDDNILQISKLFILVTSSHLHKLHGVLIVVQHIVLENMDKDSVDWVSDVWII